MAEYARPGAPGAAVAILRRGRPVLTRFCGLARLEDGVPVHEGTNFRLASISKQFTARAVSLLIAEGRLSLDTPVREVLPELERWGHRVRVGHLVAHTSGVPHYERLIEQGGSRQVTDADVVRLVATRPLDFEPGARFDYSNGAYTLLARVVEERSGRDFTAFLEERIFEPLGMSGTVAHVEGRTAVPHRALGYRPVADGFEAADQGPTTATLGDGGIYSSIRDLALWDAALGEPGDPADPAALEPYQPDRAALEPHAARAPGVAYGFGWFLDRYRGRRRQRHEGWTTGFQNEIQRFPEEGLTVIVLTNRSTPAAQPLAEALIDLALQPEEVSP